MARFKLAGRAGELVYLQRLDLGQRKIKGQLFAFYNKVSPIVNRLRSVLTLGS
jgi:hypothetical protein